ncbi:FecR family protein [Pontibacter sp. 13R65]|uniref:FecR family protein n=1 Tax=Pontibacter sp. 13R65 TaxID=3127458 RepID=UPI00301D57C1
MNREQYWQQAFQKYLNNEASQEERKTLEEFLQHLEQQGDAVWQELEEPEDEIKKRLQRRLPLPAAQASTRVLWYQSVAGRIAATILLVLGFGLALTYYLQPGRLPHVQQAHQATTVAAAAGEQKQVILPDGTTVLLNGESQLTYSPADFGQGVRHVDLQGEAFFEVKRDTLHPFLVATKLLTTRVLGTSFNINTHDNIHSVTVATGLVEVSEKGTPLGQKVQLHPSEKATFDPEKNLLHKQRHEAALDFAWMQKVLVLQELPLQQALAKVERWYGVRISYDPQLSQRTITARYENEKLENVMESLSFLLDLSWEQTSSNNLLLHKQPN